MKTMHMDDAKRKSHARAKKSSLRKGKFFKRGARGQEEAMALAGKFKKELSL